MNPQYFIKRITELAAQIAVMQAQIEALKERVQELEPRKPGRPRKDVETN